MASASTKLSEMGNSEAFYSVLLEVELSRPPLSRYGEGVVLGRSPLHYRIIAVFHIPIS